MVIGRIRCTTGKREASRLNAEKISSVPDDEGNFISTALRAVIQRGRNIYYSGEESVMILHMQKSEYYSFNAINFRLGNVSVLVARR